MYYRKDGKRMKEGFCAALGWFGASLALLFGGWDANLKTLLVFMAIDFVLGIVVAALFRKSKKTKNGALSSKECLKGIVKKVCALVLVIIGARADVMFGTDLFRNAIVIAVCASECISIIENIALTGLPVPKILLKAIEIMKDKGGENDGESEK